MASGVVLLAAGSSRRFPTSVPKQLLSLQGKPLFLHSLKLFSSIPSVKEIVVVVSPNVSRRVEKHIKKFGSSKSITLVKGGRFRGESVKHGVNALSKKVQMIFIHDTARPLLSSQVIRRVERATLKWGVALAAWPLPDTLKLSSKGNRVMRTIPRHRLWLAQTPQGFRRPIAEACLLRPSPSATDDVELAERKGYAVKLVEGDPKNIKVTYPHDLRLCKVLAR